MLLVIDAGNTHIAIGVYKGEDLMLVSRLATDRTLTEDRFAIDVTSILSINGIDINCFSGAVISSVVPEITRALSKGVTMVTGCKPIILGPGVKTGLNIKLDNPAELGADLAATAVGALKQYELPCVILDLGTATKVTILDEDGAFLGGAIAPGVQISLDALANGASQLSSIAISTPRKVIGTNTPECIRAGLVLGTADMLDGLCDRMEAELGKEIKTFVATGGLCRVVVKNCRHKIIVNEELLLEGLREVYLRNT